jgi:hypothetical protein
VAIWISQDNQRKRKLGRKVSPDRIGAAQIDERFTKRGAASSSMHVALVATSPDIRGDNFVGGEHSGFELARAHSSLDERKDALPDS